MHVLGRNYVKHVTFGFRTRTCFQSLRITIRPYARLALADYDSFSVGRSLLSPDEMCARWLNPNLASTVIIEPLGRSTLNGTIQTQCPQHAGVNQRSGKAQQCTLPIMNEGILFAGIFFKLWLRHSATSCLASTTPIPTQFLHPPWPTCPVLSRPNPT